MRTFFLTFLATFFFHAVLYGQGQNGDKDINPRAKRIHKKGQQYFYKKDFESAAKLFKKAIGKDSSYIKAYMDLASCYLQKKAHRKRRKVLGKVIEKKPEFKDPYYNLASDYYINQSYSEAIKYYKKFLEFRNLKNHYKNLAKKRLKKARFRVKLMENPVQFDAKNVGKGVNTDKNEYWPVLTIDRKTLYFTRQLLKNKKARGMRKYNEDIYKSKRDGKNNWKRAKKLKGNLNSRKNNEGAIAISPNGRYIIFTGCQWPDTRGRCDLYYSRQIKGKWIEPRNLGRPVNTKAKETQPSIAFDGNTLYFASNRGNKRGNLDIWKSKRTENGTWGKPERLSDSINTKKAEQSPFIHSDNQTLYFASKGHKGMGNFDLFYSRRDTATGKFQKPKNLGYPINKKGKEIGLFVSSDGKTAFFASEKEGGFGGLDIYQFTLPEHARAKEVTYVKGKIEDGLTNRNLNAQVKLKDLKSGDVVVETESSKGKGEFLVPLHSDKDYGLNITKKNYIFYSEHLPIKSYDSAKPFHFEVKLDRIKEGKKAILNNIFFEFDSHKLKKTSKSDLQELIKFMQTNPGVVVQIQGHTDNKGSDQYNQKLSQKRAKSVYEHLINKGGIPDERLDYKGFGEKEPIATNETEEGRAKNRRTEFKIIKVKSKK